jgi:Ca2+-binding EF-hand superfamily protein
MLPRGVPAPPRGAPPAAFYGAGRPPPMLGGRAPMGLGLGGLAMPPPRGLPPRFAPRPAAASAKFGTLNVTVQAAKDLTPIDGAASSVLDSLVIVSVGGTEEHTPVCAKGGTHPTFNAPLSFAVRAEREIDFAVFFRRPGGAGFDDTCVGRGRANFMPWIAQGQFLGSVELKDDKGQPAGAVVVAAKFERVAPAAAAAAARPAGDAPAAALVAPGGAAAKAGGAGAGAPGGAPAPDVGPRNPNSKFTDKEIRDAFTSFDLDKNDFVGAAEIRHVLVNIGENVTDEEIDEMIRMCDRDGDGQVSFEEFYRMVTGGKEPPSANALAAAGGDAPGQSATMVAQRNARKTALQNFVADFNVSADVLNRMALKVKKQPKADGGLVDYTEFCDIVANDPSPVLEKIFKMFDADKVAQIDSREVRPGRAMPAAAARRARRGARRAR